MSKYYQKYFIKDFFGVFDNLTQFWDRVWGVYNGRPLKQRRRSKEIYSLLDSIKLCDFIFSSKNYFVRVPILIKLLHYIFCNFIYCSQIHTLNDIYLFNVLACLIFF